MKIVLWWKKRLDRNFQLLRITENWDGIYRVVFTIWELNNTQNCLQNKVTLNLWASAGTLFIAFQIPTLGQPTSKIKQNFKDLRTQNIL
jgi:hypothetical protein